MAFPMMVEANRTRRNQPPKFVQDIVLSSIPPLGYFSWLLYCRFTFGSWLPTGWSGMYSVSALLFDVLPHGGLASLLQGFEMWPYSPLFILFVSITPFLIVSVYKIDNALALYSVLYFLGVLAAGALASIPRFLSFLFPIWLPLASRLADMKRSNLAMIIACISFLLIGVFFWISFINGVFIA